MNEERAFSMVVADDDGLVSKWVVRVEGEVYDCETFGLIPEQESQWWDAVNGRGEPVKDLDLSVSEARERFTDIEAARRFFATGHNIIREGCSIDLFEDVDPVRFNHDRIESDGLHRMLAVSHPHPWIADGTATHAFAVTTHDSELCSYIWSLVMRPGGYSARRWAVQQTFLNELMTWTSMRERHLVDEPEAPPPEFHQAPDAETIVDSTDGVLQLFGDGDEKLEFYARDMLHILFPNEYPRVAYCERMPILDMVAIRR